MTKKAIVCKMLDISTGHVTKDTCNNYDNFVVARYEYGVLFYLPDGVDGKVPLEEIEQENIPDDLLVVFNFALQSGCQYVKLDCDGTVYDDLTLYVW